MCGRYSFTLSMQQIRELFTDLASDFELDSHYNIAPTHETYIIRKEEVHFLDKMQWGLIPNWAKDKKMEGKLINARAETIHEKPSFKNIIKNQRCVIIADSFYEWRKVGAVKTPYRILDIEEKPLMFAGIYDTWISKEGQSIKTFTILTTKANKEMKILHDRMPVIFNKIKRAKKWLTDDYDHVLQKIIKKPKDNLLKSYPISSKIGNPKYNDVSLHDEKPAQLNLFDL